MTDVARHAYELEMARYRVRQAKQRVDRAQRELDVAEDEWHLECQELDRLESADPSTLAEKDRTS